MLRLYAVSLFSVHGEGLPRNSLSSAYCVSKLDPTPASTAHQESSNSSA